MAPRASPGQQGKPPKDTPDEGNGDAQAGIINVINTTVDNTEVLEAIMALREDITAQLDEVKSSLASLAEAISHVTGSGGQERVAELEAIVAQLKEEDVTDKETIARLQAVADQVAADNDAIVASLQEVDASIDSLTQTAGGGA